MISWIKKRKWRTKETRVYDWVRAETEQSKMTEGVDNYEGNDQRNND